MEILNYFLNVPQQADTKQFLKFKEGCPPTASKTWHHFNQLSPSEIRSANCLSISHALKRLSIISGRRRSQ